MRQIPSSSSLLSYLDNLEYIEAGLSADEETSDLAKPFQEEIAAWEDVFRNERAGRRGVTRAEAMVAVRNAQLDRATLKFGANVLAETGGDRKASFFRRFFSAAPSQLVRQPLRKQCDNTLNIMVAELDKLDKKHPLRSFTTPLTTMAKAALTALDARTKVKAARSISANDVDEWKEGVNTLRLSTYAELLKLAAEKSYGRAWADSFFPSESTAGGAELQGDDPPVPAEGGDAPESP